MKTLQEIKDQLAIDSGYVSWGGYVDSWRGAMPQNVIDVIAKAYAKQFIEELKTKKEIHSGVPVVRISDIDELLNDLK